MNTAGIRRYTLFAASIAVFTAGSALCIRANLGVIPQLCPPYVIGCIPGQELSVGTLTAIMQIIFVAIQAILLRSDFSMRDLVQIPSAIATGLLLDFAMIATQQMQWDDSATGYTLRIVQVTIGIALVIAGYAIQKNCHEKMAGEGLIMAFSKTLDVTPFVVAAVFELSMIAIGLIFCIFYFGTVRWDIIGAGTLLSLIVTATYNTRTQINKPVFWKDEAIASDKSSAADGMQTNQDSFPLVITIARTHGSGGHDIGYMVAQRLGINFYDKEIISETAKKLGLEKEKVQQWDQDTSIRSLGRDEAVFSAQSQIIRDAAKESCVIIGRCADYVLRGRPFCLNIFIRSDEDYAVTFIRNKDNLAEDQAREVIRIKNKARERHYAHYTGEKWQDPSHYDIVINTAKIGIESAADIICNAVNNITGR
ncbi:MAG: cytidylate kinase family protein [Bacteroidales bacterium]|nr:cytidylate kinase family protein [Bacteroidales bacterium]